MNNPKNNRNKERRSTPSGTPMRWLPFVVEFVKFSAVFCVIIAAALLTLHVASAMQ